MKNMIKMSLVAAVAVAGLSSNVAAKPLEEAIKNVEVSGMMRYRFDSNTPDNGHATTSNDFDTDIMLKSKVSDKTTAVVKVEADHKGSDNKSANTGTSTRLDAEVSLAYVSTKIANATVSVGRVAVPGPFDDAQGGDGALATLPVGPVTLAAGFFNRTSAVAGQDAHLLAIMGTTEMISYDLYYANVSNTVSLLSAHAAANVAGLDIDAMYTKGTTSDDFATTTEKDASLAKLFVSGSYEAINLTAGVAFTGDNNGQGTNRISIDNDGDAGSDIVLHELSVGGYADATAFVAGISTTLSDVTVGLDYLTVNAAADVDADELDIVASYKLDTNLKLTGIYAIVDDKDAGNGEYDSTRIEVKYTF